MDIMQMLRLSGIFGPTGQGTPPFVPGQVNLPQIPNLGQMPAAPQMPSVTMPPPEFDANARMAQLYSPETMATDRFNQLVADMPRIQDYKPNLMSRIGGGLMSIASSLGPHGSFHFNPNGIESGMNFMNRPYLEQFADWKNATGPAYQAAQLERYNNANERQMAYQTINQDRLYDKQKQDNDVRESRLALQRWKAENPNSKFDFSGPTVKVVNPANGQVTDTGIATGRLTDADKIEAQTKGAIRRVEAAGEQARETEGVRQTGREAIAETRGWEYYQTSDGKGILVNKITGETKDPNVGNLRKVGTDSNSGETPQGERVRQNNAARELKSDPELGKFIKILPNGSFEIAETKPGGMFSSASGPTKEQRDRINAKIFGQGNVQIAQPTRTNRADEMPTTPKGGRIRVRDNKTGKTGSFAGTPEEAIKAGFSPIG